MGKIPYSQVQRYGGHRLNPCFGGFGWESIIATIVYNKIKKVLILVLVDLGGKAPEETYVSSASMVLILVLVDLGGKGPVSRPPPRQRLSS